MQIELSADAPLNSQTERSKAFFAPLFYDYSYDYNYFKAES
jgi:hypothetical protein